jgi:hypothetical protein
VPEIVGARFATLPTVMVNAGSEALAEPSLTLIAMLANVPAAVGVPDNRPVVVLNVAQLGRFAIANVSVLPSGSLAVGVNEYAVPTVAVVAGVPEIVGGRFVVAVALTVTANAGRAALAEPSLTLIVMPENTPTLADVGVPVSWPVAVLNVAQLGRFAIAKVSVPPSGSLAVGVNEYAAPTVAVAGGVPEIVGDWLVGPAPPPLMVLTVATSLAAPAVICVSAGANAVVAPVGNACVTAAGSMPAVRPLNPC